MNKKRNRTMDTYLKAGALMRLYKTIGAKVFATVGSVVSAADRAKLLRAMNGIDAVCSNAEDNMFRDHPHLPEQYINVFYGTTEVEPRNDMDRTIMAMAREIADDVTKHAHTKDV